MALCCAVGSRKSGAKRAEGLNRSKATSPSQLSPSGLKIEHQGEDLHVGVSGFKFPDGSWLCGEELNCQWTTTKASCCGKIGEISAVDSIGRQLEIVFKPAAAGGNTLRLVYPTTALGIVPASANSAYAPGHQYPLEDADQLLAVGAVAIGQTVVVRPDRKVRAS